MSRTPRDKKWPLVVMLFAVFMVSGCEEIAESACRAVCEDQYEQCIDDDVYHEIVCEGAFEQCSVDCEIPD